MTPSTAVPVRNDIVAGQILAALASTPDAPSRYRVIESILDRNYNSHRGTVSNIRGVGAHRAGDRSTSVEAALRVNLRPQEQKILDVLVGYKKPLTAPEIAAYSGYQLNSISTRMKALVLRKSVTEVGTRTINGRRRILYSVAA